MCFSFILTIILILNTAFVKSPIIGGFLALVYLAYFSYIFGKIFFWGFSKTFKALFGFFFVLGYFMLFGSIIYYLYKLDIWSICFVLLDLPALSLFLKKKIKPKTNQIFEPEIVEKNSSQKSLKIFILFTIYLFFYLAGFYFLLMGATDQTIRSPWEVVSKNFFVFFFLGTLVLTAIICIRKFYFSSLILLCLHFFQFFSVALIVYKIGYGYDPFVHQAALAIIEKQGFILPKTFYYIGQYSLEIILAKIFFIKLAVLDKLLLPILSSLFAIPAVFYGLAKGLNISQKYSLLCAFLVLIFPLSAFIVTTPQNLANLIALIVIFLSLLYLNKKSFSFYYLLLGGLAACSVHPLSGICLLIFICLIWLFENLAAIKNKILNKSLWIIFLIGSCFSLAIVFYLNYYLSSGLFELSFNFQFLKSFGEFWQNLNLQNKIIPQNFNLLFDLLYFYGLNLKLILFVLAGLGFYLAMKNKTQKIFRPFVLTFFVLIFNFIFLRFFVNFNSVIEYERNDYADRVLDMAFYFLFPLILYFLYLAAKKINESKNFWLKIFAVIFSGLIITGSLYLCYPRNDLIDSSKGYSLSQSDIKAAQFIENDSQGKNYFVLTNQITSAAALKEFGFAKYYGKNFYYPIPTSETLYQYYLKMVEKNEATKENAGKAMEFMDVDLMYFAIPTYWHESNKIIEQAKNTADFWTQIDGKIYIFKFEK